MDKLKSEWPGMRVKVWDVDHELLGNGTLEALEQTVWTDEDGAPIIDEDDGEPWASDVPLILLDSGLTIRGYDCWWEPLSDDEDKKTVH